MEKKKGTRGQSLDKHLISFGAAVCKASAEFPTGVAGTHFRTQIIRSATSPAANYAEARASESRRDFIHKLQVCLKELRETSVWLKLHSEVFDVESDALARECDELISIMVTSIRTARRNIEARG